MNNEPDYKDNLAFEPKMTMEKRNINNAYFKKPTNKKELVEFLNAGFGGSIYRLFGCFSADFYPFENHLTTEKQEIEDFANAEGQSCESIEVTRENLKMFISYKISTVFNGYRFYFKTLEQLKEFCEIAEKD